MPGTLSQANPLKFSSYLFSEGSAPADLKLQLELYGCSNCELGRQDGITPVVYRGNPDSKKMIIGECPGKDENIQKAPFVGKAGILLDKIFKSVGWDTEKDFYLTNTVKCRGVAPPGSGRENITPKSIHCKKCLPYLEQEINYIQPHTVVLVGRIAAGNVLQQLKDKPMYSLSGKVFFDEKYPGVTFFVLVHPAAILHTQNRNPDEYQRLRKEMWQNIQRLKAIVDEQEE